MCSVGDSFGVELQSGTDMNEYVCNDCSKKFKGIGSNVRCPKCHSKNVTCQDKE